MKIITTLVTALDGAKIFPIEDEQMQVEDKDGNVHCFPYTFVTLQDKNNEQLLHKAILLVAGCIAATEIHNSEDPKADWEPRMKELIKNTFPLTLEKISE